MHIALLPGDRPTYEALSYTWDLNYHEYTNEYEGPLAYIKCDGLEVSIKENISSVLCRLREQAVPRLLWVDALCINQEDVQERSYQVQRMGCIYQNAFRVVIWFGKVRPEARKPYNSDSWWTPPPTVPATLAQETFSGVCEIVDEWRTKSGLLETVAVAEYTTQGNRKPIEPDGELLSPGNPLWRKVFYLYDGRWFKWLWVIQEAALANSAIVIWDDSEISWKWIGLAAAIIRTNFQRISTSLRKDPGWHQFSPPTRRVPTGVSNAYFMYRLSKCQRYFQPLQFTFLQLLRLTRQFGCKDDRDRVLGLLGLPTTDKLLNLIVPDYASPCSQVYFDVARLILDSSKSLTLFSNIQPKKYSYKPIMVIPSWVPQCVESATTQNLAAHVADYARCILKEGLWWSLEGDFVGVHSSPSPRSKSPNLQEDHSSAYVDLSTLEALAEGGNADRFLDAVATTCSGRKLFQTKIGLVGVGPLTIEEGDVICILFGADVPFTIRSEGKAVYSVVGECYIGPLMRGEVIRKLATPTWQRT